MPLRKGKPHRHWIPLLLMLGIKNVITEHGVNVNKTCQKFKAEIDENDQYLF